MERIVCLLMLFVLTAQALFAQNLRPMLTLEQAAKQVSSQPSALTTPKFIDEISERIRMESHPSIHEEIVFLLSVENYEIAQKTDMKLTLALLDILNAKHKDDPESFMPLLLHEVVFYRNVAPDAQKLGATVSLLSLVSRQLQNRQAIAHLTHLVELGESYQALPDGEKPGEMKNKAREYYIKALNFPMFDPVYEPSSEVLKKLYLRAAIDLVSITTGRELTNLRFVPFAWDELERVFPEKSKLISHEYPGIDTLKKHTASWLRAALQDTDAESDIYKHITAVLAFLQTRKY